MKKVVVGCNIMMCLLGALGNIEASADDYHFVSELTIGNGWAHIEDYVIPFGRDMSVQCEPARQCEVATGIAAGGDVGKNNRGIFSGNKVFNIGPIGAVYARMADDKGPGVIRYYAGKIGTHTWQLP